MPPDFAFAGVATDTRVLQSGELFFALRGENFDGHDFLPQAVERGAAGAVIERNRPDTTPPGFVLLRVADPLLALAELARHHRQKLNPALVAVTGSAGKTTTKEMVAHILRSEWRVRCSPESWNNEIGVPLTLLQLEPQDEIAVLEFAMRGAGQIRYLADCARPTTGVITNIGESHLELLGSLDAIAEAKGELLEALPRTGQAVLNCDDRFYDRLRTRAACPVTSFGFSELATVRGTALAPVENGATFQVQHGDDAQPVELPVAGRHNAANALAAIAVARLLGLSLSAAAHALRDFTPARHRSTVARSQRGVIVLDDCYNASPASVAAALQVACDWPHAGKKVFVFGDMKEIGPGSPQAHRTVGRQAADLGFSLLVTVGDLAQLAAHAAQRQRPGAVETVFCDTPTEALDALRGRLQAGDLVLVKASRAMHLEQVVEGLVRDE